MLRTILLAALFLLSAPAQAAYNASFDVMPSALGVSGVALNTNPNFTIRTGGYAALTVYAQVTKSSMTALTMTCVGGPNAPGVTAPLSVSTVAANGAISLAPASWTYPVAASGTFRIIVSPVNDYATTCTLGGTGAGSSDLVTAYARVGGTP